MTLVCLRVVTDIKPSKKRRTYPLFLCLPTQNDRPENKLVVSERRYHRHKTDRLGFLQNVKPQGGKTEVVFFSSSEKNQGQVVFHKQTQFEVRAESNARPFKKSRTQYESALSKGNEEKLTTGEQDLICF